VKNAAGGLPTRAASAYGRRDCRGSIPVDVRGMGEHAGADQSGSVQFGLALLVMRRNLLKFGSRTIIECAEEPDIRVGGKRDGFCCWDRVVWHEMRSPSGQAGGR
jgi:hypothetical protein